MYVLHSVCKTRSEAGSQKRQLLFCQPALQVCFGADLREEVDNYRERSFFSHGLCVGLKNAYLRNDT